jgi:hypothetical protein
MTLVEILAMKPKRSSTPSAALNRSSSMGGFGLFFFAHFIAKQTDDQI